MKCPILFLRATVLPVVFSSSLVAQEPEGNAAVKHSAKTGDLTLSATEFAMIGMTGSSVGISLDDKGSVFVSHTNRRNNGEIDIRKNKDWLADSLSLTSAEDRQALIKKRMPDTWKDLAKFKEKIIRLDDTDGDGIADKRTVVHEGFNDLGNGLAGGVLWHDGALYVTCMPSLYKLTDPDGDGIFDKKQELVRGIGFHIGYGGHDMHGPTLGMDGRIYWSTGDKGIHVKTKDGREFNYPGEGGVFRIEPDGSGFEVFAHGLRNPQELAFDEFGNLFTVDNDGDFGDKERVHYVVEGTDSGWRMHYQYRSDKGWAQLAGYNPWLAENLWKPQQSDQPAYLTPSLANYSAGPIGFEYNPGTALSDRFAHTFFLAESSKQISALRFESTGAGFKMLDPQVVLTGPFITGLFFGPDGALYGANWGNNEWAPHEKGNVLKLDDEGATKDSQRESVKKLIAEGMSKRSVDELAELLGHADQRVRLKAQFELVTRADGMKHTRRSILNPGKAAEVKYLFSGIETLEKVAHSASHPLIARVHAVWALGQLARGRKLPSTEHNPKAQIFSLSKSLVSLLTDKESEVRAQAARMLSDAKEEDAASEIAKLLADESPRVRLYAGIALRKLGTPAQIEAAVKLLEDNADRDVFLRHAGAMALAGCGKEQGKLASLASSSSKAVKLGAIVAARMIKSPDAAAFLEDADMQVVAEASRAIHDDLSIPSALQHLAEFLEPPFSLEAPLVTNESVLRRSISANLRVGDGLSATRLLIYAAGSRHPAAMRAEALDSLSLWPTGLAFDRVQGFHRALPARDAKVVADLFAKSFDTLITDDSDVVQKATARLVRALHFQPAIDKLTTIALDASKSIDMRATAIETMAVARAPRIQEAIDAAITSDKAELRIAAIRGMAEVKPDDKTTFDAIDAALKRTDLDEQQAILSLLGSMKSSKSEKMLGSWIDLLSKNKVPATLALDVYEAAVANGSKTLKKQLGSVDKNLKKVPFGVFSLALEGGDAKEGETIFKTSTTGACIQCHTMQAGLPSVGPDLSHVAARLPRERLLRAVVDPQSEIAEGFGMVSATLKNGSVVSGLIAKETNDELILRIPASPVTQTVAKKDIVSRTKPASAMPQMTSLLTKLEIRNLAAYLATLK
ncbi:MAG: HEAT repeat domain-containing protein [Verrucomicrobiaceae bacterium]|nr:HEAT repeat domain-containing protein [Verrucomicrobiaceae bacterium]